MLSPLDLDLALATARRAVAAASVVSLAHFRRGVRVEHKPDRSPVTVADRESEAAILREIRAAFPGHAILAEETGEHSGDAASRWIVDPLDGTRGFTRGETNWGPLVALEHEGEVVAGAMGLPALGESYSAARGRGAWLEAGGAPAVRLAVSGIASWADATFSMGEPLALLAPPLGLAVQRLVASCARTRCHGDLAGFAMVVTGRAEVWVEAGVQTWDIAPMKILVEEAGGSFSDLAGRPSIASGGCIASNGRVHRAVLDALRCG